MGISVIIPVLNEERTIEKTLFSLSTQAVELSEIIVVDGGSTDTTREIASQYAKVSSSPRGRAMQMNHGAGIATGDILFFLHADCQLSSSGLSKINEAMKDPQVSGGGFSLQLDSTLWIYKLLSRMITLRSRITHIPYGDQGIFIRKSIFEQLNGYRIMPLFEDSDLCRRMKKTGKVVILREPILTSTRRWDKEGVYISTLRNWWITLLYYAGYPVEKLKRFYT